MFPPSGPQDGERASGLRREERDYLWFCLEFCGFVLARRPRHREALEAAAGHLTSLGFYSDGLELDRRLGELCPDDPGVLYNLACSLSLTGRPEEALDTLGRAVAAGYADHRHMRRDRDLDGVRLLPSFHSILALAEENAGRQA